MRRHFFATASVVSLLAFVAAATLGLRSYHVSEEINYYGPEGSGRELTLLSLSRGELVVRVMRSSEGSCSWAESMPSWNRFTVAPPTSEHAAQVARRRSGLRFAGVTLGRVHWERGGREHFAIIPVWLVSVLLALAPTSWIGWWARRRRLSTSGRCSECGYDLRASEGRCPECGTRAERR